MTDKPEETAAVSTLTKLKLAKATALQQQGLLQEAKIFCEDILKEDSDNADCLHLMGLIAMQEKDYYQAAKLIAKAVEIYPHNPTFFYHLGVALQEQEELDGAMTSYDLATVLKPDFTEAWYNWGNALQKRERFSEAVACYDKVLTNKGDFTEAHYNRAVALKELKKYEEAVAGYDQAIALKPDYAEAWLGRGNTLVEMKCPLDAIPDYDHALALRPDYAEAYFGRGVALHELEKFDDAITSYDRAIVLRPDYAEACQNRAAALQKLKINEKPLAGPDQTLALKQELKLLDDAIAGYDRPLVVQPSNELGNVTKVDLCCGTSKPDGFIGVDRFPGDKVDIVADLTERFPFADNSVDVVRACNAVEHLPDRIYTMNEIWRICKPNAKVDILVPSTDGRGAFQDPTHVSYWNINSFLYYSVGHPNHELCKRYGFRGGFEIETLYDVSGLDNIIYTQAILRAIK